MSKLSPLKTKSYLKKQDLFFDSSKLLSAQVTDIFDFMWPTIAGMWNLRWQVTGYLATHPNVSVDDLRGRFTKGSGGERANLKRAYQEYSWSEQQEQFALFLLINAFAIYESWITNTIKYLELSNTDSTFVEKNLQFSTIENRGIRNAINRASNSSSIFMKDLFYTGFTSNFKNSLSNLDDLLICFRCFKELRNCFMHNGGVADSKLLQSYTSYISLSAPNLGIKELPLINLPIINKQTSIDIRGVVGFYDIILRIVATVDAEISLSIVSESILIQRFKAINSRKHTLGAQQQEKESQVKRIFRSANMPIPNDLYRAERFLRDHSLVS